MTIPRGFLRFTSILSFLEPYQLARALHRVPGLDIWGPGESFVYKQGEEYFGSDELIELIGQMLEDGELPAAAIIADTGALVWVPAAAWRIQLQPSDPIQIRVAWDGGWIQVPRTDKTFVSCIPIVAERDLLAAFGAETLLPAPSAVPEPFDRPEHRGGKAEQSSAATISQEGSDRTGAAGRPSSAHLVLIEFRRRKEAGEVQPTLAREAEVLANWLAVKHPKFATMAEGTIKNTIRREYQQFGSDRPTK